MTTAARHQHRPCPVCGGVDRFYLIPRPRSGAAPYWKCRQCSHWESAEERTDRALTPVPGVDDDYTSLDAYEDMHGVPRGALHAWGATWGRKTWLGQQYDGIRFPEGDSARWRLFGCIDAKGKRHKWVPEAAGQAPVIYGLESAVTLHEATGVPLTFVNGHSSVIAMQHRGVPAVTIPGGEGNIATHLQHGLSATLKEVYPGGDVWIALDADSAGRAAATKLHTTLAALDYAPTILDLGDGHDAADLCRLHDDVIATLRSLAEPVEAGKMQPPNLIHADDLETLPPVTWLLYGKLYSRARVMVFAPSQTGKSFYTLDIALRVAQERNVVYIAGEGASGYRKRTKAWRIVHGKGNGNLFFWPRPVNLMDARETLAFIAEVQQYAPDPALIVIDTLLQCTPGGDVNANKDMTTFTTHCGLITERTGATTLYVHHTTKTSGGFMGAGALWNNADQVISLERDDQEIVERQEKLKDDETGKERRFALRIVEIGETDEQGKPVTSLVLAAPTPGKYIDLTQKLTQQQRKVLEVLSMVVHRGPGARHSDICAYLGKDGRNGKDKADVSRLLGKLITLGYATQDRKGDPYKITPMGEAALSDDGVTSVADQLQPVAPLVPSSDETVTQFVAYSPPLGGVLDATETTRQRDLDIDPLMLINWLQAERGYRSGNHELIGALCRNAGADEATVLDYLARGKRPDDDDE